MNPPAPVSADVPMDLPDDDPRPVEPEMLPEGACCGSGCDPCVLDFYYGEHQAWQRALRAWEQRQAQRQAAQAADGPGPAS